MSLPNSENAAFYNYSIYMSESDREIVGDPCV